MKKMKTMRTLSATVCAAAGVEKVCMYICLRMCVQDVNVYRKVCMYICLRMCVQDVNVYRVALRVHVSLDQLCRTISLEGSGRGSSLSRRGLGLRVQGLWVQGSVVRIKSPGFRVWGLGRSAAASLSSTMRMRSQRFWVEGEGCSSAGSRLEASGPGSGDAAC